MYDPATDTWTRKADMPTPRRGLSASVVDGKFYAIGGFHAVDANDRGTLLRTVEVYDPTTDSWTKKADMPTERMSLSAGVVAGKIYAIGGQSWEGLGPLQRLAIVEVYNPVTNSWTKKASMPTSRASFATQVIDGQIYAIGGSGDPIPGDFAGPQLTVVEAYNPQANRWSQKSDMPTQRTGFATGVVDRLIYIIGGVLVTIGRNIAYLSTIEVYDPAKDWWRLLPDAPIERAPSGTGVVGGRIYLFGGVGNERMYLSAVEEYDTGFRSITPVGKVTNSWGQVKLGN